MLRTSHARVLAFDGAFFTWNASQIVSAGVTHAHTHFKCAHHDFRGWHGLTRPPQNLTKSFIWAKFPFLSITQKPARWNTTSRLVVATTSSSRHALRPTQGIVSSDERCSESPALVAPEGPDTSNTTSYKRRKSIESVSFEDEFRGRPTCVSHTV